jgi:hypothetical protein
MQRSFIGTARQLGKAESLIRRWAHEHDWRRRSWAYDQQQQQADAVILRQERDQQLRESLRHSGHMARLSMGRIGALVRRDPETGEAVLDGSVTPYVAVQLYRLALEIRRDIYHALAASAEGDGEGSVMAEMGQMADDELRQFIELARGRMNEGKEGKQDAGR